MLCCVLVKGFDLFLTEKVPRKLNELSAYIWNQTGHQIC